MLDITGNAELLDLLAAPPRPAPNKVTGAFLARSSSLETRLAIALRMLSGGEPVVIEDPTISQIARLCRVPRQQIDRRLGSHRSRYTPDGLVKAFRSMSEEDRVTFLRIIADEKVFTTLEQACAAF